MLWEGWGERKREYAGHLFPLPIVPCTLSVLLIIDPLLLFFSGISSGSLCGGERLATMSLEFEFHLQFAFGSASTVLLDIPQSA